MPFQIMFTTVCGGFYIFLLHIYFIFFFYYLGRPNLLNEDLLSKLKDRITRIRLVGGVVSRRMVVSIGTGVIETSCPEN